MYLIDYCIYLWPKYFNYEPTFRGHCSQFYSKHIYW